MWRGEILRPCGLGEPNISVSGMLVTSFIWGYTLVQRSIKVTAVHGTGNTSNHKNTAILLAAGANPTLSFTTSSGHLLNKAAINGDVS